MQEDTQNLFDVALTAEGLVEILFTPRTDAGQAGQNAPSTEIEIEIVDNRNFDKKRLAVRDRH